MILIAGAKAEKVIHRQKRHGRNASGIGSIGYIKHAAMVASLGLES